ncbi:MAG: 3-phosphoshikimate 1-carboxyvinyltransferase [Acidobacteriota bacterium]
MEPRTIPAGRWVHGEARPPGSKSATHRVLNLALLAGRPIVVEHPLEAEDTLLFRAALESLGWSVEIGDDNWRLTPGVLPARAEILCGNAGTMFRFLVATLATLPGEWVLDGVARLRERPVGPLLEAMSQLGARIESLGLAGHAPLRIHGGSFEGGRSRLDAGESSQYLSAILMAGLRALSPTELELSALTSEPYVDLTREAIAVFGGQVENSGPVWRVSPAADLGQDRVAVEGDWSAACYPAAAAALAGEIAIRGVGSNSRQGDRGFLGVLRTMGAVVETGDGGVIVRRGELAGIDTDLSAMPDQVPTLAALAPFARGTTEIRNVAHLRIKESDRLSAMADGLRALGVPVDERRDGLSIRGVWADRTPPGDTVLIDPRGDHRIAMAFALVGIRRPGVRISQPEVVAKSYPRFWSDLDRWLEA